MFNLEETNRYFNSKNIILRKVWLLQALKFYNISKLSGNINDFLIQNWLMCDIGESSEPKSLLIFKNEDSYFPTNHIFQINSIRRIDIPLYYQYINFTEKKVDLSFFHGDNLENFDVKKESETKNINDTSRKRCLMLELFDGKNTYFGIENEVIDFFSLSIPPGMKILIRGNILFQNNILYLNKSSIVLLGGKVESLCEYNKTTNILQRELKLIDEKSLPCSKNVLLTSLSCERIDEFEVDNKISQNIVVKKDNSDKTESYNQENIGITKKKSNENILGDVVSSTLCSLAYLKPLCTSNLNENSIPNKVINDKNISKSNNLVFKKDNIKTVALKESQQTQSSLKDLHCVSLVKDSENEIKCNSQGCKQNSNKNLFSTYVPVCEYEIDKSLTLFVSKNMNENQVFNKNQEKDINYHDRENILKRKTDENFDFFEASTTSLKMIKKNDNKNILNSERIVSIQEAKELATISFGPYHGKIKGEVVKILSGLSIEDNMWKMKILIKDDSETTLECLLDNSVVQDFVGMTAEEALHLKMSNFTKQKESAKNRLDCFLSQLVKSKNLVFSVDIFNYSLIPPLIVKIQTFQQFKHKIY